MINVKRILLVLAFSAMVLGAGRVTPVRADLTYDLWAVSLTPLYIGDFHVVFTDKDHDGAFDYPELDSWSWLKAYNHSFYLITNVPVYPPLLDGGGPWPGMDYWSFMEVGNLLHWGPVSAAEWTYSASAVPIPPSVFLLGTGLIPLAWARRKKRLGQ